MAKAKVNQSRPELVRAKKSKGINTRYRYPSEVLPHSMVLTFKKYDYKDIHKTASEAKKLGEKGVLNTSTTELSESTTIVLPLPTNLVDNTALMINGFAKDMTMDTLANLADGGLGKAVDGLKAAGKAGAVKTKEAIAAYKSGGADAAFDYAMKNLEGTGEQAKAMASFALAMFQGGSQTLSARAGTIVNPKETLAFEGVNLRPHSFKWDLVPMDITESEQIKNIVNVIKQKALPQTADIGEVFSKVLLSYPHVVDIDLVGVDNNYFMDFKTCMITNVSVQYGTGEDVPILKGGKPAVVSLTLELMELESQTADDYGADPISIAGGQTDGVE